MNLPHISSFNRIQRWHAKARQYMLDDPEVSLMFARKTSEVICKIIYFDKISQHVPPPIGLEDLLAKLKHGKHLPQRLKIQFRTIQSHGNFGSHDQGDASDEITVDFVEPCIKSLDFLCQWLRKDYLCGKYQTEPLPEDLAKKLTKDAPKRNSYIEQANRGLDSVELELSLPVVSINRLKNFAKSKKCRPREIISFWIESYALTHLNSEYQTEPLLKDSAKRSTDCFMKQTRANLDFAELELVIPRSLVKQLKDFAKYKKRRPRDIVIFWSEKYARV